MTTPTPSSSQQLDNDELSLLAAQYTKVLLKENRGSAGGVRVYTHDVLADKYSFFYLPYTYAREVMYGLDEGQEDISWKCRRETECTSYSGSLCVSGACLDYTLEEFYKPDKERGRNKKRRGDNFWTPTVKHTGMSGYEFQNHFTRREDI